MNIINYLKETRNELNNVTWPTRAATITFALLVIAISAIVALFLSGVDLTLKSMLTALLKKII